MVTDQTSLRERPLERLRLGIGGGRFNKWAVLIAVVGLALLTHYHIVSPLRQLPSPIYGGDYYFQLGQTNHVASGGNPLGSATIDGTLPSYFVTHSFLAGITMRLTGVDAITTEFALSYVIVAVSVVAIFFFVLEFVPNFFCAAIVAILFVNPRYMPVVKYTQFTALAVVPIFLLMLHRFRNNRCATRSLLLGAVYGVTSLSHSAGFIGSSILRQSHSAATCGSGGKPGATVTCKSGNLLRPTA